MACDYCGAKRGHLNGCDGSSPSKGRKAKAVQKRKDDTAAYEADKARQQEQAKRSLIGRRRSTRPRDVEIAKGCHVEKDAGGYYVITEDKDRGKYGRSA